MCTAWGTGWRSPPGICVQAQTPGQWQGPVWWVVREYSHLRQMSWFQGDSGGPLQCNLKVKCHLCMLTVGLYHLIWHWEQRLQYTSSRDTQQLIIVINIAVRTAAGISWGWHHSALDAPSPASRTSLWGSRATPPGSERSLTTTPTSRDRRSRSRH